MNRYNSNRALAGRMGNSKPHPMNPMDQGKIDPYPNMPNGGAINPPLPPTPPYHNGYPAYEIPPEEMQYADALTRAAAQMGIPPGVLENYSSGEAYGHGMPWPAEAEQQAMQQGPHSSGGRRVRRSIARDDYNNAMRGMFGRLDPY